MILFLDDNSERCQAFLHRCPDATIVRTATDAITLLRSKPWQEVHLDHDLNWGTYQDPSDKTSGMEVVRFVLCNKPDVDEFIVHSHNEIAGPIMVTELIAAGYVTHYAPFRFLCSS